MFHHKSTALVFCVAFLGLGACGGGVPGCSSDETKELVIQIADDEMKRQLGQEMGGQISYSVSAIRTRETNTETGSHTCAAELQVKGPRGSSKIPIEYTVETTDSGEEFYVEVYGL